MSLVFNQTSSPYNGIIQMLELEVSKNQGYISGNTVRLAQATSDINLAWDDYLRIAFMSSGRWQFDDSNHADYPIITTNIVASQRDYSFTTDENSNLILDIHKVAILSSATATFYDEVSPVDAQRGEGHTLLSGDTNTGTPVNYDKTANGIFLDPIPSYAATNGLKIYINREASYFVVGDTTKKPGCPGLHHRYFVLRPALEHARRNSLSTTNALFAEVQNMEDDIKKYFAKRNRDERNIMTHKRIRHV